MRTDSIRTRYRSNMDVVASTSTSNVSSMPTFPLTSYANDTAGEIKAGYDSVKFDSSPSDNASVFSEVVADETGNK